MHVQILVQALRILEPAEEGIEPIEHTRSGIIVPGSQVLHGDPSVELLAAVEVVRLLSCFSVTG